MKKKLIAIAVAGAFIAPVAMADTGNVNLYGLVNMSWDATNTGAKTASANQNKVSSNSSRIGLKGSEDLGGGTNAIFQLETQITPDAATATSFANRNSFAGLSGDNWGTVLLGTNDSPYKASTRRLDLFADGIADNRSLMGAPAATAAQLGAVAHVSTSAAAAAAAVAAAAALPAALLAYNGSAKDAADLATLQAAQSLATSTAAASTAATAADTAQDAAYMSIGSGFGFDTRPTNVIQYNSPNISGFSASISYAHGAEAAANTGTKGNVVSLAGMYEAGPIYATFAYQENKIGAAGSGTLAGAGSVSDNRERSYKLGGSYTVDQFQVNLVYEKTKDDFGKGLGGDEDIFGHHSWYLAGKYNVSASDAVKLAYTRAGDKNNSSDTGAKQISVGYDHAMSKRTMVYALYTRLQNDKSASYALSNAVAVSTGAVPGGVESDPRAFSIGIKHTF